VIEFFAIGTAIIPTEGDKQLQEPTLTISLDN
jgi:hypothetical protein